MKVRDPAGKPVDLIGSPFHIAGAESPQAVLPPKLGEHTEQILRDVLKLDAAAMEKLRIDGVAG